MFLNFNRDDKKFKKTKILELKAYSKILKILKIKNSKIKLFPNDFKVERELEKLTLLEFNFWISLKL